MALILFENKHEFAHYVEKRKPREIWCADFSDEHPHIIVEKYYKKSANVNYTGYYNKQGVLLSGKFSDFLGFWKESFYIKIEI